MASPNGKLEKVYEWLQVALELELATIPPYLVALLSIKLPSNREAAELIRSVMIEEMLHMVLVANVLNAIGGTPRIDEKVIPHYPLRMRFQEKGFRDRQFLIDLAPFGKGTLEIFMKIEEPRERALQIELMAVRHIDVPALSIGEFYDQIVTLLEELEAETPGKLFIGALERQIAEDYYWSSGGEIVAVHDLASAKKALSLVIAQGEGAWNRQKNVASTAFGQPLQMGHYYRFSEIYYGQHYEPADDPSRPPTGSTLPVDFSAVYTFKVSPSNDDYAEGSELAALNNSFNARYTRMIGQIGEAMNGTPKALYTAIMNGMHELTPVAHAMMKLPIPGDPRGQTGCPTFGWVTSD